jgi:hypothetical protein
VTSIYDEDLDKILPLLDKHGYRRDQDGKRKCVVCEYDSSMQVILDPGNPVKLKCSSGCSPSAIAQRIWEIVAEDFPTKPESGTVAAIDRNQMTEYQLRFAVHTCPRGILNGVRKGILNAILTKGNGQYMSFAEMEQYTGFGKKTCTDNVPWLEANNWLTVWHGDRDSANRYWAKVPEIYSVEQRMSAKGNPYLAAIYPNQGIAVAAIAPSELPAAIAGATTPIAGATIGYGGNHDRGMAGAANKIKRTKENEDTDETPSADALGANNRSPSEDNQEVGSRSISAQPDRFAVGSALKNESVPGMAGAAIPPSKDKYYLATKGDRKGKLRKAARTKAKPGEREVWLTERQAEQHDLCLDRIIT